MNQAPPSAATNAQKPPNHRLRVTITISPVDQDNAARNGRQVQPAGGRRPSLVGGVAEAQRRPGERRDSAPGAKQDQREPGQAASAARCSHAIGHGHSPSSLSAIKTGTSGCKFGNTAHKPSPFRNLPRKLPYVRSGAARYGHGRGGRPQAGAAHRCGAGRPAAGSRRVAAWPVPGAGRGPPRTAARQGRRHPPRRSRGSCRDRVAAARDQPRRPYSTLPAFCCTPTWGARRCPPPHERLWPLPPDARTSNSTCRRARAGGAARRCSRHWRRRCLTPRPCTW